METRRREQRDNVAEGTHAHFIHIDTVTHKHTENSHTQIQTRMREHNMWAIQLSWGASNLDNGSIQQGGAAGQCCWGHEGVRTLLHLSLQANSYFTVHCAKYVLQSVECTSVCQICIAKCGMHISVPNMYCQVCAQHPGAHLSLGLAFCTFPIHHSNQFGNVFLSNLFGGEKFFNSPSHKVDSVFAKLVSNWSLPPTSFPTSPGCSGQPIYTWGGTRSTKRRRLLLTQPVFFQHLDSDQSVTLAHSWSCLCLQRMHFCICQLAVGLP